MATNFFGAFFYFGAYMDLVLIVIPIYFILLYVNVNVQQMDMESHSRFTHTIAMYLICSVCNSVSQTRCWETLIKQMTP